MSHTAATPSHDPVTGPLPPDIHLVVGDADLGPLGLAELSSLFAEGKIGPKTLAWHPALDGWAEIGTLPEIAWVMEAAVPSAPAETPPAPTTLTVSGFAPRFAAGVVDLAIWLAMVFSVGLFIDGVARFIGQPAGGISSFQFNLLAQCAAALYFIIPMSWIGGGATPGYWMMGLKLVDRGNLQAPSLPRTFIWYIATYLRLVGCLTYFIDSQHRMLHNFASGTLVVDRGRPS